MRIDILGAALVALAAALIGATGPALATMQRAPVASPTAAVVLVQDQQQLQRQQLKQQQMQQQQYMQREKAEMRRAMIKHEERKIIGAAKKYWHQYEAGRDGGAMGGNR
ncbi:MAG TPA: hypothetical protein VNZ48_04605 [Xanthobacteraceae bacterium]|nr:hypothetical protein [Xanthobacteraceae bacterium]